MASALNPVEFTENVVRDFLRYQVTSFRFADERLRRRMRELLSLDSTRNTPLLQGPFVSLSKSFKAGTTVASLVEEGVLHRQMPDVAHFPSLYLHQEEALRSIQAGQPTLVSTGTGSGKTECFLYPTIDRLLRLRDEDAPPGIRAIFVYPMNALAEDQLLRLREMLAGTGISFGMYIGKTPGKEDDVVGVRLPPGASRADYRKTLGRTRREKTSLPVLPPEERASRADMRAEGRQPRILLTNVKQLELLLTRGADVELFDGAELEYLVFDEAHTFSGANGAETAALVRRLVELIGSRSKPVTFVGTSATLTDPGGGDAPARRFGSRFFGVRVPVSRAQPVGAAVRARPAEPRDEAGARARRCAPLRRRARAPRATPDRADRGLGHSSAGRAAGDRSLRLPFRLPRAGPARVDGSGHRAGREPRPRSRPARARAPAFRARLRARAASPTTSSSRATGGRRC